MKWYCRCGRCGCTVLVQGNNLISGNSTTCCADKKKSGSEHHSWTGYAEIKGGYWGSLRRDAKRRGLEFKVSIEYVWGLYLKQDRKCALSGRTIAMQVKGKTYPEASLDRIDSTKGYIEGNLQWVHKRVNRLKMDMTDEEFISLCRSVAESTKDRVLS